MIPPIIEIAGRLYLIEEWDMDKPVGARFTLVELNDDEADKVRSRQAERDREIWARLIGERNSDRKGS